MLTVSCMEGLLDVLEDVTGVPDPPTIIGDTPTGNSRPSWHWEVPDSVSYIRYQLNAEHLDDWETANGTVTSFTPQYDLSEGEYTLYVQFAGETLEWSESASFAITIDFSALEPPLVYGPGITSVSQPVWEWNVPEGGVQCRYQLDGEVGGHWISTSATTYVPSDDLREGDHTLYVQVQNILGNWSVSGTFTVSIDQTPPTISGLNDDSAVRPSKSWSWGSDDGNAEYRYVIDTESGDPASGWSTWGTANAASLDSVNGTYYLHVQARDALGNESTVVTVSAVLYSTPPDPPVVAAPSPTNDITPTWNWSIPAETDNIRYQLDNEADVWSVVGGTSIISYTSGVPAEGDHTLYVQAMDAVGNWSTSGEATVRIDLSPPVIEAGGNVGWINVQQTLTGSTSDATMLTYLWQKVGGNGTVIFGLPTSLSTTVEGISREETSFIIQLTATDEVGYSSQDTLTLYWDKKAPTPGNSGTITTSAIGTNSLSLNWTTAIDLSTGDASLEYRILGSTTDNIGDIGSVDFTTDARFVIADWSNNIGSVPVSGLAVGGAYYFNVFVRDSLGNVSAYNRIYQELDGALNLSISVVAPQEETMTFDQGGDFTVSQNSDVTILVSETFDTYEWRLYGLDLTVFTGNSVMIDRSNLYPGTHHLTLLVTKNANLYSKSIRFYVNN